MGRPTPLDDVRLPDLPRRLTDVDIDSRIKFLNDRLARRAGYRDEQKWKSTLDNLTTKKSP
jgi:hypothetical protein